MIIGAAGCSPLLGSAYGRAVHAVECRSSVSSPSRELLRRFTGSSAVAASAIVCRFFRSAGSEELRAPALFGQHEGVATVPKPPLAAPPVPLPALGVRASSSRWLLLVAALGLTLELSSELLEVVIGEDSSFPSPSACRFRCFLVAFRRTSVSSSLARHSLRRVRQGIFCWKCSSLDCDFASLFPHYQRVGVPN